MSKPLYLQKHCPNLPDSHRKLQFKEHVSDDRYFCEKEVMDRNVDQT